MSVLAIPAQRDPSGHSAAPGTVDETDLGGLGRALAGAGRALAAAAVIEPVSVATPDLTDGISAAARLEAQLAALRLALTAEADRRQVAQESGATGTDAWTAKLIGSTPRAAAAGVRLARMLIDGHAATRAAFASGAINQDQARVILEAAALLPGDVTAEERARAEDGLLAKAVAGMDPRGLRNAGRRMLEVVSKSRADVDEADRLRTEERRAEHETWMTLGDNGDGTWSGRFTVPALHGEMLRAALERLTAPRRLSRNGRGDVVDDPTLPTGGPTLPWPERLGHGFCELVEHLPADGFGRGGMGIVVHLDLEHLLDGLGSARVDTGTHLSAGEARRLACAAGIIPAVLGTASLPLDLGRETRLHTASQARALSAVHDTCAAEGCERPFAWCDVHHPHPWSQGGRTDLGNAVPLCGWHHHRVHDSRFDHRYLPDGQVRFTRRR